MLVSERDVEAACHSVSVAWTLSGDQIYRLYNEVNQSLKQLSALCPSPRAQALEEGSLQELLERLDAGLEYEGDLETENDHIELFNTEAALELFSDAAAAIRALSSQPVADGWLPIETAPKDKQILGFGPKVGRHICSYYSGQWQKSEMSASFQLSRNAITLWHPLLASPGASE